MATDPKFAAHQPMEVRHCDELEWETIRWPGETGKMLFHPRAERPTEPNAGSLIFPVEDSTYSGLTL